MYVSGDQLDMIPTVSYAAGIPTCLLATYLVESRGLKTGLRIGSYLTGRTSLRGAYTLRNFVCGIITAEWKLYIIDSIKFSSIHFTTSMKIYLHLNFSLTFSNSVFIFIVQWLGSVVDPWMDREMKQWINGNA